MSLMKFRCLTLPCRCWTFLVVFKQHQGLWPTRSSAHLHSFVPWWCGPTTWTWSLSTSSIAWTCLSLCHRTSQSICSNRRGWLWWIPHCAPDTFVAKYHWGHHFQGDDCELGSSLLHSYASKLCCSWERESERERDRERTRTQIVCQTDRFFLTQRGSRCLWLPMEETTIRFRSISAMASWHWCLLAFNGGGKWNSTSRLWSPVPHAAAAEESPFQERNLDAVQRILHFTDYFRFPHVLYFDSIPDLLARTESWKGSWALLLPKITFTPTH